MRNRIIAIVLLLLFSVSMFCAEIDYTAIDPSTVTVYIGSMNDPEIKIVYRDSTGTYIFIEKDGKLYVHYL
jgi:hypothetical protein